MNYLKKIPIIFLLLFFYTSIYSGIACTCEVPRLGGNERDRYQYAADGDDCCSSPANAELLAWHYVDHWSEGAWVQQSQVNIPPATAQSKCCP